MNSDYFAIIIQFSSELANLTKNAPSVRNQPGAHNESEHGKKAGAEHSHN